MYIRLTRSFHGCYLNESLNITLTYDPNIIDQRVFFRRVLYQLNHVERYSADPFKLKHTDA